MKKILIIGISIGFLFIVLSLIVMMLPNVKEWRGLIGAVVVFISVIGSTVFGHIISEMKHKELRNKK